MPKISKDTPLAQITLRRYEKPNSHGRPLVRKLILSLGLLQPGDSRDVIVDIVCVLIDASKHKKILSLPEIENKVIANRKHNKLALSGIAASNITRQLRRLREIHLIEKIKNSYRLTEFGSLAEIFDETIMKYYVTSIQERIYEYCLALDSPK